jgi:hypothetical protein
VNDAVVKPGNAPILLVSEARGEVEAVERIRGELAVLGRSAVHVTASAGDVGPAERGRVLALDEQPAYRSPGRSLDEEQRDLGVNLRRVWQADLRSWREGYDDDRLARIAVGYLAAWRAIVAEHGPFAGVWGEEAGHLAKRTAFLLAQRLGIPVWFLILVPLPGRLMVLEDPLYLLDAEEFRDVTPTTAEREYASALLGDVRESRIQFATPRDLRFRPARVARFGSLLLDRYVRRPAGYRELYPLRFAELYARQRVTAARLRRRYRPPGSKPFVFFPAHYASDAQITVRAPQWENQLHLIEHLARSLPYGYELAVKEHPFHVGGLPHRPLERLLDRLPIRLLPPTMHAHDVLRSAAAVAAVNSTAGFEALFFGVPLVTLGHGPYRGLGLTRDVVDLYDTPQALLDAVSSPAPPEAEVVRLVALLLRRSQQARPLGYDLGDENIRRHAEILAGCAEAAGR